MPRKSWDYGADRGQRGGDDGRRSGPYSGRAGNSESYGNSWGSKKQGGRWEQDQDRRSMTDREFYTQKAKNAAAASEGRAVYVRGIPLDWSADQLDTFMKHQSEVESVNLLPIKPGQKGRAGFVNFVTAEGAVQASQVCDNLPVEDNQGGTNFRLSCSIKKAFGQKVDMVSGFSDLSKARQERRCLYVSSLPDPWGEMEVLRMVEPVGVQIEHVKMLPKTQKNTSCFLICGIPEDAEKLIRMLDGQMMFGRPVSVSYPTPPKRTRDSGDVDERLDSALEIRGFPAECSAADISAAIEAGGREVVTVKILRHSLMTSIIALVYMKSPEDAQAVIEELDGFEMAPGYMLKVLLKSQVPNEDDREPRPPQGGGADEGCPSWARQVLHGGGGGGGDGNMDVKERVRQAIAAVDAAKTFRPGPAMALEEQRSAWQPQQPAAPPPSSSWANNEPDWNSRWRAGGPAVATPKPPGAPPTSMKEEPGWGVPQPPAGAPPVDAWSAAGLEQPYGEEEAEEYVKEELEEQEVMLESKPKAAPPSWPPRPSLRSMGATQAGAARPRPKPSAMPVVKTAPEVAEADYGQWGDDGNWELT